MPGPPRSFAPFGTDLRLLDDLHRQETRDRGRDLRTAVRPETGRVDLERTSGVENLEQALLLRFLTPLGGLAVLGHRDYGSRLWELIGEPNTETNRNRAKLFVLQALAAEPRVEKVLSVEVTTRRSEPTRLDIAVKLVTIGGGSAAGSAVGSAAGKSLNLVFPFFLDGAVRP